MVTTSPADTGSQRELRMRAAVMAPRAPLPRRQRRLKGGTTSFMVVMHVLATVALLPRFW
ncbi:acyl-CoA desaturase, partial [Pseudomonas sp. HMWF031]